ncbi:hypothetical protein [Jidongwangia harbinensis]|uniref:hypothetical protein n=1 Tax=Jidongwangia harbinensis TaxID=2878561 RepID=UPI001CDA3FFF|nr:hypothetical protein [Jidongwangia harbinensis]MCA2215349.1 hypothetical protein [Jidongwangia harbinensis]
MATTLLPIDPQMSPQRVNRILTISANLLPAEVVVARRARRARTWTAVVVLFAVALCGGWFALAYHGKQVAERDLEAATDTVATLQFKQREYSGAVQVRNESTALSAQLDAVMANDLDWGALLETLRTTAAPSQIVVKGVNGKLHGDEKGAALPGATTTATVGALVVTGTGPDKRAVAAFVDALAEQSTLANPYVTSVTTEDEGVTFALNVDLAEAALCGRFTDPCKTGGN